MLKDKIITDIRVIRDLQRTPQCFVVPADHIRNILYSMDLGNYIFSVISDLNEFVMGTIK